MEDHQLHIIEDLADRLHLSEGELRRIAEEITHGPVRTLYDLTREETNRLITYLDSLAAACVA